MNLMNRTQKAIISILGGLERVFYFLSPILLVTLFTNIFPSNVDWLFWTIGLAAVIFRGIEVGGWLK